MFGDIMIHKQRQSRYNTQMIQFIMFHAFYSFVSTTVIKYTAFHLC